MSGFRAIKEKARRALHDKLEVPAFYFRKGSKSDPLMVTVRVHSKLGEVGDLKGTSFNYAETSEVIPKVLFMRDQLPADLPDNQDVIIISPLEGYRISHVEPADGISISAVVSRMSTENVTSYPAPTSSDA